MGIYSCGECGAVDCKLWRPMSVIGEVETFCWTCLESLGHTVKLHHERRDDQVYDKSISFICYGPAVPDLDGSWWGYTSVPYWWCEWWNGLPDKRHQCTVCRGSGKLSEYDCVFCKGSGARPITSKAVSIVRP